MSRDLDPYVEQLRALFPRGKAWPEARGPVWNQLLRSLAVELQRVDTRIIGLIEEADPRTTMEALEDFERELGLPDPCLSLGASVEDRRRLVIALLLMRGGQSPEYFTDLAALFGFDVVIEEVFPGLRCGVQAFGAAEFSVDWSGCEMSARFGSGQTCFGAPAAPFGFWVKAEATEASVRELGASRFGEAFLDFGNPALDCLMDRFKPAHTLAWFQLDATGAVAALEN